MSFVFMNMIITRFCRLRQTLIIAKRITCAAPPKCSYLLFSKKIYVKQAVYKSMEQTLSSTNFFHYQYSETPVRHAGSQQLLEADPGAVGWHGSLSPKEQWHQFLLKHSRVWDKSAVDLNRTQSRLKHRLLQRIKRPSLLATTFSCLPKPWTRYKGMVCRTICLLLASPK